MSDKPKQMFDPNAWKHKGSTATESKPPEKVVFNPQAAAKKAEANRIEVVNLYDLPLGPLKAWSFSALMKFEDCPYASYLSKIEKAPDPSGPAAERGSKIHQECEDFIQGVVPEQTQNLAKFTSLLDEMRTAYEAGEVEVEQDWAFDRQWGNTGWTDSDCWARVKLDVMHHETDTSARVIDWKTGRKFGNEIKHGQQLQIYALAAFIRYPKLEFVRGQMIYLDKGEEMTMEYTRAQALMFQRRWEERALRMTTATEFKPKPSKHACRWCAHRKVQEGHEQPFCKWGVE